MSAGTKKDCRVTNPSIITEKPQVFYVGPMQQSLAQFPSIPAYARKKWGKRVDGQPNAHVILQVFTQMPLLAIPADRAFASSWASVCGDAYGPTPLTRRPPIGQALPQKRICLKLHSSRGLFKASPN
jgi:hypothetical protein